MFLVPVVWLAVAVGVYIAALRSGMRAIRWGVVALVTGPILIPLFNSHKKLTLYRAHGRNVSLFRP